MEELLEGDADALTVAGGDVEDDEGAVIVEGGGEIDELLDSEADAVSVDVVIEEEVDAVLAVSETSSSIISQVW